MAERVLSGRYVLEEKIGSGGMAEVYRAHDHLLDRTVAVKILHAAYKNDLEFIERFHREAKAAAGLSHPNVVSIFDVGIDGDDHFIVMEYVPGSTLKEKIKSEAPLDIPIAVRIAKDIANGLAHAHANKIVHCDIKPHNILMTDDNRAKIGDFGIARAVTESTMTYSGSVMGSVHYFSPEQARGSMITPKSDVYSLGIVLYEMLTGRLPFNGDNPVSVAMKHVEEEPIPPSTYRQNIPPMLEAVVLRAMNKNPDVRPTSSELVQELSVVEKTFGMTKTADPDATQVLPRAETNIPSRRAARRKPTTTEPAKKSFFQSKMFMAGLITFLLVGFGIGSFLAFGNFFNQEEVTVPDVTGKQLALARQLLEDGNLRVNVAETYNGTVPPGQVVSQDPESGKTVRSSRLVTIYVSKGGEEIEMPDLKGLTKSAATEVITKAGLNLDSTYEKYSEEEPGTVLSQDPAVGTKINRGSLIDITVSRGESTSPTKSYESEEPVKVTKTSVPDLRGASLEVARSGLESRGLTVGIVTYQVSGQAEGTVISQTPSSGTEMYSGEAVDLVISERDPSSDYSESSYAEPSRDERSDRADPSSESLDPVYYEEPATRSFEPESEPVDRQDESAVFDAPSRDSNASKSR